MADIMNTDIYDITQTVNDIQKEMMGLDDDTLAVGMNGYLSYSRVHGDTRLNDAKMAEIAERKSM